jgi:predicted homoserine dehydrogenase-like protein
LAPGDTLDQIGEYTYRAWVMQRGEAVTSKAIPCGLLEGATVTAPIAKGSLITYENTRVAEGSKIAEMRARQDMMIAAL